MPTLHTARWVSAHSKLIVEVANVTHTEYKAEGLNGGLLYLYKHGGGRMILPLHTLASGVDLEVQSEHA